MRLSLSRVLAPLLPVLPLCSLALTGCDNDIDSDSLVRELRVLAMRIGDPTPRSAAEVPVELSFTEKKDGDPAKLPCVERVQLKPQLDSITLSALVAAPTGPGRRIAEPRQTKLDWYVCVGPVSLAVPGTLDPQCTKWGPDDPKPADNPALFYLGSGSQLVVPTFLLAAPLSQIFLPLLQQRCPFPREDPADPMSALKLPVSPMLLPVLVRASAVGGDPAEPRDSEVGYTFLRLIVAQPQRLPPPNRNPIFGELRVGPMPPPEDGSPPLSMNAPLAPCLGDGPCSRYVLGRQDTAYLAGRAGADSIERYVPADDSGRGEIAEQLRYSWFATDGTFKEERTGEMFPDNEWKSAGDRPAPPEVKVVQLWFVVQDERGGTDWGRFELELKD